MQSGRAWVHICLVLAEDRGNRPSVDIRTIAVRQTRATSQPSQNAVRYYCASSPDELS